MKLKTFLFVSAVFLSVGATVAVMVYSKSTPVGGRASVHIHCLNSSRYVNIFVGGMPVGGLCRHDVIPRGVTYTYPADVMPAEVQVAVAVLGEPKQCGCMDIEKLIVKSFSMPDWGALELYVNEREEQVVLEVVKD